MTEGKLLMTVEEAAERLSIGRSLIYEHVLSGEIRSIKLGRCRRIASADLERFVNDLRGGDIIEAGKAQNDLNGI